MNTANHQYLISQLLDRHKQLEGRGGYYLFISEVIRKTNLVSTPFLMTIDEIEQWNEYFTEWEMFTEAKKCQYDTLAALEQA